MEFLLGITVGVAIGFFWGVWRATQSFIERIIEHPEEIKELMSRVKAAAENEPESKDSAAEEYRTEWHDNICYLYDCNDNFMAQGANIIEAMKNAEQRFPGLKLNFRINDPNESNQ